MPDAHHVHRIAGPAGPATDHVTDGSPCWCRCRILAACPSCPADEDGFGPPCWRCGGEGLVEAGPDDDGPLIVVHEDATGPPARD